MSPQLSETNFGLLRNWVNEGRPMPPPAPIMHIIKSLADPGKYSSPDDFSDGFDEIVNAIISQSTRSKGIPTSNKKNRS